MIGRRSHVRLDTDPCGANCYMMNSDVMRKRQDTERRTPDVTSVADGSGDAKESQPRDDVTVAPAGGSGNHHRGRKRKRPQGVAGIIEPRSATDSAISSAASSCSEESDNDAGFFCGFTFVFIYITCLLV